MKHDLPLAAWLEISSQVLDSTLESRLAAQRLLTRFQAPAKVDAGSGPTPKELTATSGNEATVKPVEQVKPVEPEVSSPVVMRKKATNGTESVEKHLSRNFGQAEVRIRLQFKTFLSGIQVLLEQEHQIY